MGQFRTNSFTEVLDQLVCATSWLESLGINWRVTRFRKYVQLAERFANGSANERNALLAADRLAIYNATLETKDLLRCHAAFAGRFEAEVRAHLRTFVGGPERYPSENTSSSSNRSRDMGFELRLLASLIHAGALPVFDSNSDVTALFRGRTLHFECKRPQSGSALRPRIREAVKQLERTLSRSVRARSRGVVAVDTTKLANPDLRLREYHSREQLVLLFDARCQAIGQQLHRLLPVSADQRVTGLLAEHREVAIVSTRDGPDPYTCGSHIVVQFPSSSLLDYRMLWDLGTQLAPAA